MAMEKNAVVGRQPSQMRKVASAGCPVCGSSLDHHGSLPRCPKHGTAPFEHGAHISARGGRGRPS